MFSPALRQLDIKLLVAFHEIYSEGHLTRAAMRCGLTQSALSQSLSRLRTIFGDPLFLRTRAGMIPTETANAVAPTVREILRKLDRIVETRAEFDPAKVERCLRIGTYQFASITLAPPLLAWFRQHAPLAQLSFTHAGPAEAPQLLFRGEIDLAMAPFGEMPADFGKMILARSDHVVASRHDWTEQYGPMTLESYFRADHISIVNHGLQADPLEAHFDNTAHRRRIAISVPHYITALHLAANSDLLATLPRKPAEWLSRQQQLAMHAVPLPLPPVVLSLLWHRRSDFDPFVMWTIDVIRARRMQLLEKPGP